MTGFAEPRPQQRLAAEFSLDEQLVILEAETGSGKTEAALWRFARLFESGRVDSLYFALPTRAAAIQIHGRVQKTLAKLFGDQAPEAVLAIPGYLRAGEVHGQALPDWKVRWDDNPDEAKLMSRWAAESARRYLAATVAVGTVDQAMLAALQVKHAHLRASALGSQKQKTVGISLVPIMSPEEAGRQAILAARTGARVLVIRNTVKAAIATWEAVRLAGEEELLMQVAGGPALHHSRFAPEDRKLLDAAVETALSPELRQESKKGVVVIGTQTLEQSLDIDADLLIADLCPVDVLLQRIGRLHRHKLTRPAGFETPKCIILSPENGLAPLLAPAFENGLGAWRDVTGVLQGVYRDLSILELTRRLIEDKPEWTIPAMNRRLVESATHPDRIEALHRELGKAWVDYWCDVVGKDIADAGSAKKVALQVDEPFSQSLFASDEEKIRTRLGGEGARVEFAEPVIGPFGETIRGVTLPAHWSHGIDAREPVEARAEANAVCFALGGAAFVYGRAGLIREKNMTVLLIICLPSRSFIRRPAAAVHCLAFSPPSPRRDRKFFGAAPASGACMAHVSCSAGGAGPASGAGRDDLPEDEEEWRRLLRGADARFS